MSVYDWPTDEAYRPQSFTWGAVERIGEAISGYTGAVQTREVPFSYRYKVSMTLRPTTDFAVHAARLGFLAKLRRAHRVRIPHYGFERNAFAPYGTLRGTPTLSAAAQGATSIGATTSTAGHTVKQGDLLGITTTAGVQAVTVTANATASGTAITIAFEPPLRAAVSGGASLVWNKPMPTFMLATPEWSASYRDGVGEPVPLEFIEVW